MCTIKQEAEDLSVFECVSVLHFIISFFCVSTTLDRQEAHLSSGPSVGLFVDSSFCY